MKKNDKKKLQQSTGVKRAPKVSREDRLELELIMMKLSNLQREANTLASRRNEVLMKYGVKMGETVIVDEEGNINRPGPKGVVPPPDFKRPEKPQPPHLASLQQTQPTTETKPVE